MPKCLLVCVCLFVFSTHSFCGDSYDWYSLSPSTYWGIDSADIPKLDISKFPIVSRSDNSKGWIEVIIASDLDFSGRDLRGAKIHLYGGILRNCKFDNANLEGADFSETSLVNCSFRGANLRYAVLSNVVISSTVPLSQDCDLTDAILGGIVCNLTAKQIQSTWNFKNKDFSNTVFLNCAFPEVEYDSSFNFTNTRVSGEPQAREFLNKIKPERFGWSQLPRLLHSDDRHYDNLEAHWTGEQAFRTREFRQKSLRGLTISSMDFRNCDFSRFTFGFFNNCNFQNASFKDAMGFDDVILSADFGNKVVREKFGFRRCNVTKELIEQTRFWKEGNLRGIILEYMNLESWDFSNKDLSYASLAGSNVRGANFENATLYHTNLGFNTVANLDVLCTALQYEQTQLGDKTLSIEQLKQTKSWKNKNITYCELRDINFDNCDLSGFHFMGTSFIDCSFNNANFTGVYLPLDASPTLRKALTESQIRSLGEQKKDPPLKE